jgi:ribosomal protein L37E
LPSAISAALRFAPLGSGHASPSPNQCTKPTRPEVAFHQTNAPGGWKTAVPSGGPLIHASCIRPSRRFTIGKRRRKDRRHRKNALAWPEGASHSLPMATFVRTTRCKRCKVAFHDLDGRCPECGLKTKKGRRQYAMRIVTIIIGTVLGFLVIYLLAKKVLNNPPGDLPAPE